MEKIEQLTIKDLKQVYLITIEEAWVGVELSKRERDKLWKTFFDRLKKYCAVVETL